MKKTFLVAIGLVLLAAPGAFAAITLDQSGAPGTVFQQTFDNPCVIGDSSCKQPTVGATSNHFDYTQFSTTPDTSWNGNTTSGSFSSTPGKYDVTSPVPFNSAGIATTTGAFIDDNGPYLAGSAVGFATGAGQTVGSDTIPSSFRIGLDENFSNNTEHLIAFRTFVSTDFVQTLTGGTGTWTLDAANSFQPASPVNLVGLNNGNGFSDAILQGFNLTPGNFYFFEAVYGLQFSGTGPRPAGADTDGMEEFFLIPLTSVAVVPEPGVLLLLGSSLFGLGIVVRRRIKK